MADLRELDARIAEIFLSKGRGAAKVDPKMRRLQNENIKSRIASSMRLQQQSGQQFHGPSGLFNSFQQDAPPKCIPATHPVNLLNQIAPNQTGIDSLRDVKRGDGDEGNETTSKQWLRNEVAGYEMKHHHQNSCLKKILQPKNAIIVLSELKPGIKYTFQEHTNDRTDMVFVVLAEVDGKTYTGQGLSKHLAMQNAAEMALKHLFLQKMADATVMVKSGSANNSVGEAGKANGTLDEGKPAAPEDDVTWQSFASFAMYKLLADWQNQGTHVPKAESAGTSSQPDIVTAPMMMMPDDSTEINPVGLLSQLKPDIMFKEEGHVLI